MNSNDILRIAQESMKDNSALLKNLGAEKSVKIKNNPDEDIVQKLSELIPKSTEGKILAIGVAALLAYLLLKK